MLHPQKTLAPNISPYRRNPSPKLKLTFHADQISNSNAAEYILDNYG